MSSESIRALPLWAQITIPILVIILVFGTPFAAGFYLKLARRKEVALAMAGNYRLTEDEEEEATRLMSWKHINEPKAFGALDVTFIGTRNTAIVDSSPTMLGLTLVSVTPPAGEVFPSEPASKPVPLTEEPTEEQPVVIPEPEPVPVEEPEIPLDPGANWARLETMEWDFVEALEAEVVEAEDEATRLFKADPLNSWVLPPLEEFDYLPEADKVFRDLVAREWLTGEGADVSAEWEPWYGFREMEGANA